MGRLTERDKHEQGIWVEDSGCNYHFFDINGDMYSIINKLAHYEDLEEQGRLIEVVRCSECEHYDTVGCADGCGWCDCWDIGRFTDGYCDKAKLKELEGDKEWQIKQ